MGFLAAGMAAWYLKPQVHKKWFYLAAVLGLVLFIRLAHDLFWERMGGTLTAATSDEVELDSSAASRIPIMLGQLRMAQQYPLGAGGKGTKALSPYYLEPQYLSSQGSRSSHNTPLAVLVDQGIPGFIIYLCGVAWVAVTLNQLKRMDRRGLPVGLGLLRAAVGSALAAIFVSGQFSNFLKAEVQIWCIALLAVLCGLAAQAAERAQVVNNETDKDSCNRLDWDNKKHSNPR